MTARPSKQRERLLRQIIEDTIWMAARYAHGRHTYAPSIVRDAAKAMQTLFPDWQPQPDHVLEPPKPEEIKGMVFREDYLDDVFGTKPL